MTESGAPGPAVEPRAAYFTMEVGFDPAVPTYSGGLGILAGDTLKAAADLGAPVVGMTLLHRQGYFRQRLDARGGQRELPVTWKPEERLSLMPPRIVLELEGRSVQVCAWRALIEGARGGSVPLYFLDADLPANAPEDRALTGMLYGGDDRYRLRQEALLGLGGAAMLRSLGFHKLQVYHMNEGHSALLVLALLEEAGGDHEAVRRRCVFTTHTPVPAGHDQFPMDMVRGVLGAKRAEALVGSGCCRPDSLNMTYLALSASRYVNGVAMRHGQ
ncbi:MAG: alpha-glucan family phosphorylase, partial [Elusimicrobia bacterium]|nr:alpha-glucan family phosphorylase [Elusimicrobiota bacterium]